MALSSILNRRVKARHEEEEDEQGFSEGSSSGGISDGGSDPEAVSEQEDQMDQITDEDDASEADDASNPDADSIQQISFGALAKAQDSLGKRKRSNSNEESSKQQKTPLEDIRERIRAAREEKRAKSTAPQDGSKKEKGPAHRSSKHAPMIQSSKHAVSRRRTVIEPENGPKARDPRFDSMVLSRGLTQPGARGAVEETASKNYAFLDEYRASELSELQQRLKKTKNITEKEELKRTIRSLTDKKRAHDRKEAERQILTEHRRKERELIREGKKSAPWFLKKGDVKKEVLTRRYKEMGAKERQKALERRRKKIANKERKEMPWGRRGMGDA